MHLQRRVRIEGEAELVGFLFINVLRQNRPVKLRELWHRRVVGEGERERALAELRVGARLDEGQLLLHDFGFDLLADAAVLGFQVARRLALELPAFALALAAQCS